MTGHTNTQNGRFFVKDNISPILSLQVEEGTQLKDEGKCDLGNDGQDIDELD